MRIVLHICCGVCAAGVVEQLVAEGCQVLGFFYNPNIHPEEEYQKRLAVARQVSAMLDFPLLAAAYKPEEWFEVAGSLKDEPEGGARCAVCFRLRLQRTYLSMVDSGWDAFTTTLTISPHKSAEFINQIGWEVGGGRFIARDFKKKAGFKRANQLAKEWGLYRQNYCGCQYSQQP